MMRMFEVSRGWCGIVVGEDEVRYFRGEVGRNDRCVGTRPQGDGLLQEGRTGSGRFDRKLMASGFFRQVSRAGAVGQVARDGGAVHQHIETGFVGNRIHHAKAGASSPATTGNEKYSPYAPAGQRTTTSSARLVALFTPLDWTLLEIQAQRYEPASPVDAAG